MRFGGPDEIHTTESSVEQDATQSVAGAEPCLQGRHAPLCTGITNPIFSKRPLLREGQGWAVDLLERVFTGIEIESDVLRSNPDLPPEMERVDMRIRYRGHSLALRLSRVVPLAVPQHLLAG